MLKKGLKAGEDSKGETSIEERCGFAHQPGLWHPMEEKTPKAQQK